MFLGILREYLWRFAINLSGPVYLPRMVSYISMYAKWLVSWLALMSASFISNRRSRSFWVNVWAPRLADGARPPKFFAPL